MKILIIGGSGLLGQYLNIELSKNFDILTSYNKNTGNCKQFPNIKLNLTDFNSIKNTFETFRPDVVILTAAVSNPANANKLPEHDVYKINAEAPEYIAGLCEKSGSKLIYTSTDLVYDGNGSGMLDENAPVNPVSIYAETKLIAEEKIKSVFNNWVILRTALLYGLGLNHSTNHFTQMYFNLKKGIRVKLFSDQYRTPLALHDAARMIKEITEKDLTGLFNFGGRERLSRFKLGEILCNEMNCDKNLLVKISMEDAGGFPKVKDVSMNSGKLNSHGIKAGSAKEAIRLILNNSLR